MGFGSHFIQFVTMLFVAALTCITINGQQSNAFELFRSIHQGFPLASALFVLVVEGFVYLLAHSVSQGLVKGIDLPNSLAHIVNVHFAEIHSKLS